MKKISLYMVVILTMIFFLATFYVKADSSLLKANLPTISPSLPALSTISFGTPAPTLTSTLDYEKLGLPSPTATPTFNFVELASRYLTPFPTTTAAPPLWTATSPFDDPLLGVVARKLPQNLTPNSYSALSNSLQSYPSNDEMQAFIQAATDLMNSTNADQKLYMQYLEALNPKPSYFSTGSSWLLRNDFDNDGQPEWLASLPLFFQDANMACCGQSLILFEKIGSVYKPMYYDWKFEFMNFTKVVLVSDLNNDGYLEIILRNKSCGSACSQELTISTWDGSNWKDNSIRSVSTSLISFIDLDSDGKTEIILEYMTYYKLDSSYPVREATDVYGWKNDQLVLVNEFRSPTTNPYGIMRDIYSALSFGKINEALDLAQPTIDNLDKTCGKMETYIGIEAMLAYAVQNKSKAMQSTLSKIMAHCNQLNNGFTNAANVLWQAYQQVHDPALACEAMNRFIVAETRPPKTSSLQFFDVTVVLPNHYNYCPLQQAGG